MTTYVFSATSLSSALGCRLTYWFFPENDKQGILMLYTCNFMTNLISAFPVGKELSVTAWYLLFPPLLLTT